MSKLTAWLHPYINRTVYVWGGQGENICVQERDGVLNPEGWIRAKEATTSNPSSNANRDIKLYRQRVAEGINPVYAFDCSALVVEMLKAAGLLKPTADLNTRGLYAMCNSHPTHADLRQGDLVFYSKSGKAADISHVGIYIADDVICECRGRDYGVVETEFYDSPDNWTHPWNMFGRIDALEPYTQDEPLPEKPMSLAVCKPVLSGEPYRMMQDALNGLGYKDGAGNALDADGKWGKKSRAAWDGCVANNLGAISLDVSLHIAGVVDEQYSIKEDQ